MFIAIHCLRGLVQATQVAFVHLACPFMGQAGAVLTRWLAGMIETMYAQ